MPRSTPCTTCGKIIRTGANGSMSGLCRTCWEKTQVVHDTAHPENSLQADRAKSQKQEELATLRIKYKEALKTIDRLEHENAVIDTLAKHVEPFDIEPEEPAGTGEAVAALIASDWHMEEKVGLEVGFLNRFDVDVAVERAKKFFTSGVRLIQLLQQDVKITTLVLGLLGDFITNDIHGSENVEKNALTPTDAILLAQNTIISGIDYILEHTSLRLKIICASGNHARTTQTTRFASENGHSLEYLMYLHLADHYRNEERVEFTVSEGMHTYLKVYDTTIRFHHGHAVKYQGGVGGIYIPVNKAIAQWNKGRHADLDVFGHFHQLRDGGNFICNGSLIGYNAFALSIKADYEEPKQVLFLMDKKRGRTCTWPILFK